MDSNVGRGLDPSLLFYANANPHERLPLGGKLSPQVTDEGQICGNCNIQNCHSVGAGQAPPATLCYNEYYGYSVGAAYMPPVAAARILRTIR